MIAPTPLGPDTPAVVRAAPCRAENNRQEAKMTARPPHDAAAQVSTRRVGQATVSVVSDGELLWAPRFPVPEPEWRRAIPEADEGGRV